jgi:hemerythrin-like domain-containing protein
MSPTENLVKEHNDINELLDIMTKIAAKIRSRDVFYPTDVEEIVDYLKIIVDKSHQSKEDGILYPELILTGISKTTAPLSLVEYEHTQAMRYLNEISSCVENCKIGNNFSCELLAESLTNYVTVFKNHIQREEETVFPIADKILSAEKQSEITGKFQEIEEKIFNQRFLEHYDKLLTDLKSRYKE